MQRILCVYLPDWPIQRRMVAASEGLALVLTAHDPRRGLRVVACSPSACQQGVRIGMPLAEATSLARKPVFNRGTSPPHPLTFERHDSQADCAALEELAEWCEQFSPLVGLEASEQPSSLLLEVTGLAALFGDEEALAQRVVTSFQQWGYSVRVAIADCIGAAWAVSHFDSPRKTVISGNTIDIIPAGVNRARQALAPLPLAALRLADETIGLLHDLGIARIEQVLRLPRASLAARFGNSLAKRLDQAFGSLAEIIVARRPVPGFHAQWSLEHPTHRRDVIEQVLLQLVERIALLLDAQGWGAIELECQLRSCSNQVDPTPLKIALFQPTCKASHLAELVQLQLERMTLPGRITAVSVEATTTAPLEVRQRELFADSYSQIRSQLTVLANRLGSRLGEKRIMRVRLRAEAQPERASRYLPLTGREKWSSAGKVDLPASAARPLKLFSPPLQLNVIAVAPDGPPVQFRYESRQHHIVRNWGPERIETGWWRGRSVRRDYYRVETRSGLRFWLYRQLDDGQWFLQGAFD